MWTDSLIYLLFSGVVDLVDLEGNVLNLPNRLREYASTFTQARQILILIRVEGNMTDIWIGCIL